MEADRQSLPRRRYWREMTTADFEADTSGWIAVLPVAATEQHGPHLPAGVDAFIADGLLAAGVAAMPDHLPAVILPTLGVGKSDEHLGFAGTLTLSAATLLNVLREIGDSVARAGCRKLLIMNSHGGNSEVTGLAARDLRIRHAMLVVATSWARLGYPDGLFDAAELAHGIHAGDVETSLMMHLDPDNVRDSARADFVPASVAMETEFDVLRGTGRTAFAWMTRDLSESGACGDAASASAEKGRSAADHAVARFLALLNDLHRFDPARLAG
ncbi:creatininase family protein [Microbaculum marinum]|uniref:Creatininase family protein n=1 Tax=Microbaculum marinum TaxID=1764581 RepID=A0AAW9S061_9HYPH